MTVTVLDVLESSVLQPGKAEVVSGHERLAQTIRWVHTSEILEIAPLLRGGEVLLTTGLGLVGQSDDKMRAYVRGLADRAIAALLLELGRPFVTPPEALIAEAKVHNLPVVLLHGVVPFVEITEAIHKLLLAAEIDDLRFGVQISTSLAAAQLNGEGVKGLVARLAKFCEGSVRLEGSRGQVVTSAIAPESPEETTHNTRVEQIIEIQGEIWGKLVATTSTTPARAQTIIDRGVVAVALELLRSTSSSLMPGGPGSVLIADLAGERILSQVEIHDRMSLVGLIPSGQYTNIVLEFSQGHNKPSHEVLAAIDRTCQSQFRAHAASRLDAGILVVALVDSSSVPDLRLKMQEVHDAVTSRLKDRLGDERVTLICSSLISDLQEIPNVIQRVRRTSRIVSLSSVTDKVVFVADYSVHRLFSTLVDGSEVESFISEQLGALFNHDAINGTDLATTLKVYLDSGLSKTQAAVQLGIRRQTMYMRLQRIESIIGSDALLSPRRRTALTVASLCSELRLVAANRSDSRFSS